MAAPARQDWLVSKPATSQPLSRSCATFGLRFLCFAMGGIFTLFVFLLTLLGRTAFGAATVVDIFPLFGAAARAWKVSHDFHRGSGAPRARSQQPRGRWRRS